jgi:small subunit ribosomal protein S9
MMGLEAASMDQADIDRSIEYLFPSGLAAEARPMMKPPEEVFPRQKEAEFDVEGRPFHPFFYTLKPHFYEAVYKLRDHLEAVTIFGDRLRRQNRGPDPEQVGRIGFVVRDKLDL